MTNDVQVGGVGVAPQGMVEGSIRNCCQSYRTSGEVNYEGGRRKKGTPKIKIKSLKINNDMWKAGEGSWEGRVLLV